MVGDESPDQASCLLCRFDDETSFGSIYGFDDASMGWARYAQASFQ